jgi:hypothetical protein
VVTNSHGVANVSFSKVLMVSSGSVMYTINGACDEQDVCELC